MVWACMTEGACQAANLLSNKQVNNLCIETNFWCTYEGFEYNEGALNSEQSNCSTSLTNLKSCGGCTCLQWRQSSEGTAPSPLRCCWSGTSGSYTDGLLTREDCSGFWVRRTDPEAQRDARGPNHQCRTMWRRMHRRWGTLPVDPLSRVVSPV